MGIETYYHRPAMQTRLREGPLGCYIDLFAEQLRREGHCQQGAWRNLRVVSDFSHWLARRHLDVGDVSEQTVIAYQSFRRRYRRPAIFDGPALGRLLDTLRDIGACPPRPITVRFCWTDRRGVRTPSISRSRACKGISSSTSSYDPHVPAGTMCRRCP